MATALLAAPDASAQEPTSADGGTSPRFIAGLSLVSAGGLAALGGTVSYFALSATTKDDCAAGECHDPHKAGKTASVLSMVLGGASLAVGLPLLLTSDGEGFGLGKKRPRNAFVPELRVGLGAASATWSF
ncbi:MAG: hypothetical protein R3B72_00720 [Polyangiaceae bacterium]